MEALAEVASTLEHNVWGVKILPKNPDGKLNDVNPAQPDYSDFPYVRTKRYLLEGFKTANRSIEVTKVEHVPQDTLKWQRTGRMLASGASVGLNILAAVGLIYGSLKLVMSSIFGNGDIESAYSKLGKAYGVGGLAGAMTGIAHESMSWTAGNIGMAAAGIAGLDKPGWLALHTLSDGLSSLGMSGVRYRQKANSIAVTRSIFNIPFLHHFRFLQPAEQAVLSFVKSFKSKEGLKTFVSDEPYKLFKRAAGGLISASGVLGIAALFKNKMPNIVNQFLYLPYALLSTVNLIAFGRDGQIELKRINSFKANKDGEDLCRRVEGHAKLNSTPFLGINNVLLALKGLGIESEGGIMYHAAMAFRSFGTALAMIGFSGQSALKFFKKVLFGPLLKEIWDVRINPKRALENTFKTIDDEMARPSTEEDLAREEINKKFYEILINNKRCGETVRDILDTDLFKSLINVSQIGLLTTSNPQARSCLKLNRHEHCIAVGAIATIVIDELINNATDLRMKQELIDYAVPFIIACTIHDVRHLARSHVLEKAIEGHDNDQLLMWMLQDENEPITQIIINKYGKDALTKVQEVIGHKHPLLYKAFKDCDRMHYQGVHEYPLLKNPRLEFYKAGIDNIREFPKTMRPVYLDNGKLEMGYTEVGAVQKLLREFSRYIYFNTEHGAFATVEADLPYCVGLAANPNVNSKNVKTMSQSEVDKHANEGVENINGNIFPVNLEINSGDEFYVGYSPDDRNSRILVNNGAGVAEISDWIENVVKSENKDLYDKLNYVMTVLRTPKEVRIRALVSNKFGEETDGVMPASLLERQNQNENANVPQYALGV